MITKPEDQHIGIHDNGDEFLSRGLGISILNHKVSYELGTLHVGCWFWPVLGEARMIERPSFGQYTHNLVVVTAGQLFYT